MVRWITLLVVLLVLAFTPLSRERRGLRIASKKFTESVILGELLVHLAEDSGASAHHFQELGGTKLVFEALRNGEIDVYPEYTGTIREEVLAGTEIRDDAGLRDALLQRGVRMSRPLGFENTYALGMDAKKAAELGIDTISDLRTHPQLKFGFSNEFMDRADGWPGMKEHYRLVQQDVRGLDHDLAYRRLNLGEIDVIDSYSTDAKTRVYGLRVLEDDRKFFPQYDAVLLYRADLLQNHPESLESLCRLEGQIDEAAMVDMNLRAVVDRVAETRVAAEFLRRRFSIQPQVKEETVATRVWKHTLEHLDLVRKSLIAAILFAIPLGISAAKSPRFVGQTILGVTGIVQTIPALALLVMLMAPVHWLGFSSIGTGSATAVIALFLYSLLPIVRNTYSGLHDIPNQYLESAAALGLPARSRLLLVELPIASRTILAGIKTAAVINIGFATLGALIGAGGYGQPILTGIRLNDTSLILQGAIPAAVLALLVQGIFELAERRLVPLGLRLESPV